MLNEQFKKLVIETFKDNTELLIYLKHNTLMEPVAKPGFPEHYPYYKEGQNELIRTFIQIIEEELHVRI